MPRWVDALDVDFGKMVNEFKHLAQLRLRAQAGQLHSPTQVALGRVKVGQQRQILGMQMATTHGPQSGQVTQQHDWICAARKQIPVGAKFHRVEPYLTFIQHREPCFFRSNLCKG